MSARKAGQGLIIAGFSITLFAMALDACTGLRELELVSGCAGLITSVIAAIMIVWGLAAAGANR